MLLVVMLAMVLGGAVPVLAQEGADQGEWTDAPPQQEISVTGVVENFGSSQLPPYGLRDEATGNVYYLASGDVDFGALVGQRVTAYGTPEEVIQSVVLNVTRVEPASEPDEMAATLWFELTVNKGEPPADARFFGAIPAEGGISAPLTDPDGDGVYTGSADVPRFPPGPVPPDAEPVSLPVQIVQADGGAGPCNPTRVLKDFGLVKIDGDKTFEASVNFGRDRGDTATPEDTTAGPDGGGSDNSGAAGSDGGADSGGGSGSDSDSSGGTGPGDDGGSVESGDSADSDGSNIGDASDSSGGSGTGFLSNTASGIRGLGILPSTGGGMVLTTLGAGALLIGGGLLLRRIFR
jgi:hypothetical protein